MNIELNIMTLLLLQCSTKPEQGQ